VKALMHRGPKDGLEMEVKNPRRNVKFVMMVPSTPEYPSHNFKDGRVARVNVYKVALPSLLPDGSLMMNYVHESVGILQ
jgi:hypothetical protein